MQKRNTVYAQLRIVTFALAEAKRLAVDFLKDDHRKSQMREIVALLNVG